jgi:hypothetical protein
MASASRTCPSASGLVLRVRGEMGVHLLDLADEGAPQRVLKVEDLP